MHFLLNKLLKKRNVKDVLDLDRSEKSDFDRWNKILSEGEMSVEKIKSFCQAEIKKIEYQWKNLDNTDKKNERLIVAYNIYKSLLDTIESPQKEREVVEKYLLSLLEV